MCALCNVPAATFFIEMWKRQMAEIVYDWDVADFEEEVTCRFQRSHSICVLVSMMDDVHLYVNTLISSFYHSYFFHLSPVQPLFTLH